MSIKQLLTLFYFPELFVWEARLISAGAYMYVVLKFTGIQIGSLYATMGLASLFMMSQIGIIADKWLSPKKLLGVGLLFVGILL